MPRAGHHAVLVTINRYPGLRDLEGPENDGTEFAEWLVDPAGGDVDPAHVRHVRSSDFGRMDDPYDANPTERQLVRELDRLMRDKENEGWKDKAGERLYLYFAGHGFTAGATLSDPALFSAVAQNDDPAHIAGYRYAAKIANSGLFDEIVLVMDCCQDVLKASQVTEPSWSPPDRNQSANVKLMQAFGAPRGRKAYERVLMPGGKTRGLFSSVWIEALRAALPDEYGWVTGQAVKNQVLQLWAKRFREEAQYVPPVRLPDGEDIRLFKKTATTIQHSRVQVDVSGIVATSMEPLSATRGIVPPVTTGGGFEAGRVSLMASVDLPGEPGATVPMVPGIYSVKTPHGRSDLAFEVLPGGAGGATVFVQPVDITAAESDEDSEEPEPVHFRVGTSRRKLLAPKRIQVELLSPDAFCDIVVVDANFNAVFSSVGKLKTQLPRGVYKAIAKAAGAVEETLFRVGSKPIRVDLPPVRFASAAPLPNTSTSHEYQQRPALLAAEALPLRRIGADPSGELLLFARDSRHRLGAVAASPLPWTGLRLVSLTDDLEDALMGDASHDVIAGIGACKLALPGGSYAVLMTREQDARRDEHGLAVSVLPGWRTEVYVDCIDVEEGEWRVPDLPGAAIFMVPLGKPSAIADPASRLIEIQRARTAEGRAVRSWQAGQTRRSPLLAVLAAHAFAADGRIEVGQRRAALDALLAGSTQALGDSAWILSSVSGAGRVVQEELVAAIPMLSASWSFLTHDAVPPDFADQAVASIGQWRLGGGVWTHWRQPATLAPLLRQSLREAWAAWKAEVSTTRRVELRHALPAWSAASWAPAAAGLRTPDPLFSPFQQALRRRILDLLTDDSPERAFEAQSPQGLAHTFGLSKRLADEAYMALHESAKDRLIESAL